MQTVEIENIELDLLLESIFRRYGYDLRNYARASMKRLVKQVMVKFECDSVLEMARHILHDPDFFQDVVSQFSITVTEMFRDPAVYKSIRNKIVPYLATYPFIKIWHAGCATGEEVYSLAILLKEEGLYDKCTIYATDFNNEALDIAKQGVYPLASIKDWNTNYNKSGGSNSFSDYFHAEYDSIIMMKSLRDNITFSSHNLVSDEVFGEMHLVLCRNVIIYFDKELQNRALRLFSESLVRYGFLCLGTKESLRFSNVAEKFNTFDKRLKIYRKKYENNH